MTAPRREASQREARAIWCSSSARSLSTRAESGCIPSALRWRRASDNRPASMAAAPRGADRPPGRARADASAPPQRQGLVVHAGLAQDAQRGRQAGARRVAFGGDAQAPQRGLPVVGQRQAPQDQQRSPRLRALRHLLGQGPLGVVRRAADLVGVGRPAGVLLAGEGGPGPDQLTEGVEGGGSLGSSRSTSRSWASLTTGSARRARRRDRRPGGRVPGPDVAPPGVGLRHRSSSPMRPLPRVPPRRLLGIFGGSPVADPSADGRRRPGRPLLRPTPAPAPPPRLPECRRNRPSCRPRRSTGSSRHRAPSPPRSRPGWTPRTPGTRSCRRTSGPGWAWSRRPGSATSCAGCPNRTPTSSPARRSSGRPRAS